MLEINQICHSGAAAEKFSISALVWDEKLGNRKLSGAAKSRANIPCSGSHFAALPLPSGVLGSKQAPFGERGEDEPQALKLGALRNLFHLLYSTSTHP
jgi:hypothetical protein